MFSGIKLWIAAIGSALFGGLILYARMLKKQRDEARRAREKLVAGRNAERKKKEISKEEKERTVSRTAELVREIKEIKDEEEEFEGVDILSDPNKRVR